MAMNRGRGWRRIGIVLSVIWFIGFGGYLWVSEVNRIRDYFRLDLDQCNFALNARTDALRPITKHEERQQLEAENSASYKQCNERASRFHLQEHSDLWSGLPLLVAFDAG